MNEFTDRDGREDDEDRLLSALLAAPQARPNPAVWTRVRTRLAAEPRRVRPFDALLEWLGRPAALAAATAALVVALGTGWSVMDGVVATAPVAGESIASSEATTLVESLLEGEGLDAAAPVDDDAPRDSGGRS